VANISIFEGLSLNSNTRLESERQHKNMKDVMFITTHMNSILILQAFPFNPHKKPLINKYFLRLHTTCADPSGRAV